MDRDLWVTVLSSVKRQARRLPHAKRLRYADWLVVAIYLWSVWHDRPMCWACERTHYGALFRPRKLPSVSQLCRRLHSPRFGLLLQRVHEDLAGLASPTSLSYLDGKPLVVGVASKDPDARKGHVMGGWARGYKLHVWATHDRRVPLWSVTALNVGEQPVAAALCARLPELSNRSLVLADQNYDGARLHKLVEARGGRLLVRPRGVARHPVTLRQMGAARRQSLKTWARTPRLAGMVYRQRIHVEGVLSNLCSVGGGLGPLPAWVRTLDRVRRWVGAKIILHHARLKARPQPAA